MTPDQAEEILDAVVECRHTSRQMATNPTPANFDADDQAFQHAHNLITATTRRTPIINQEAFTAMARRHAGDNT